MFRALEERLAQLSETCRVIRGYGFEGLAASCGQTSDPPGSFFCKVGEIVEYGATIEVAMGAVAKRLVGEANRRADEIGRMQSAAKALEGFKR
jgi:hypothetical protein